MKAILVLYVDLVSLCRHLDMYEKVNHFGEDTDRRDEDDDEGLPINRRKAVKSYMNKVPMSYNYKQHNVSGTYITRIY
jgi:hypothetical protein